MSAALQAVVAGLLIKPKLNFWQIFNIRFGISGIQFGFAPQNGNAFPYAPVFLADEEHLPDSAWLLDWWL